jgi:RNA polymerase sigma-70 factor (ECF subfamily)
MKSWLTRATRREVLRGGADAARSVPAESFQAPDEPYPRHWRRRPRPWSSSTPAPERVRRSLADLPDTWRAVLVGRFVRRRPPSESAESLGLSPDQERAIANQALADLRRTIHDDEEAAP